MGIHRVLSIGVVVSALSMPSHAADWPRFLGPDGNGVSSETGLLDSWDQSGPRLRWSREIGTGYSAPSIAHGKLVLHHRKGSSEVIECLQADTGKSLWSYEYPSRFIDPYGYNNGPRCTPTLTKDHCFTFGAEGKLLCLTLAEGKKVWERDTQKDWNVPEAFFGVGSTPLLDRNRLIVMVGAQTNSGVVAVAADSGKTIWENVGVSNWQGKPMHGWPGDLLVNWRPFDKQASYASPVKAKIHGRDRVLCFMRQGLVSLDPETGVIDDSFWFRARVEESVNASNPIVFENGVFLSSAYYKSGSVMLDTSPEKRTFSPRWRTLDIETHWMTPILLDGFLYAFSGRNEPDARFRCFDLRNAKLRWDRDESWRKHDMTEETKYGRGSMIFADGKLIVLGETGLLGIFKPSTAQPTEVCRYKPAQLKYPCWTAPVLSNKALYLRSESQLLCYDFQR